MAGSSSTENAQNYVFHDDTWIKEDVLIKMAKAGGSIGIAEHYLCSLLYHAVAHRKEWILKEVNDVREFYGLLPYPTRSLVASGHDVPNDASKEKSTEVQAREMYRKMNEEKRKAVLKEAITRLWLDYQPLFYNKTCWIGVYLVVKDRLDGRQTQKGFLDFAEGITPINWPAKLKISKSTMKNYGRYVKYADRELAYYEMKDKPWEELCDTFWCIVKSQLQMAFRRK